MTTPPETYQRQRALPCPAIGACSWWDIVVHFPFI